jgi:hypothetical protein
MCACDLGFKSGTRIIELLVSLGSEVRHPNVLQTRANFKPDEPRMELCRMAGRPMAQAHARSAFPAKPPIETGWDRARIKTAKKEAPARRPEPLKFLCPQPSRRTAEETGW